MHPTQFDVIIIGAGPSGTTAATLLHRLGHSVCVLEKQYFPRFVIGESLLPRCLDLLEEAGLLDAVRERGYLHKDGAVFLRGDERATFRFDKQHSVAPSHAWQVPRADFDKTLADAAVAQGVPIHFGHEVVHVTAGTRPVVIVRDPSGEQHTLHARFIIDASGYGRVLPRLLQLDRPSHLPRRDALFAWVAESERPAMPEGGRTWVCMHPDGAWIWVIPFTGHDTSVGVVATPEFFERHPSDPAELLRAVIAGEPNVANRLGDAPFVRAPERIDGYSIGVSRLHGPGYCLVGNTMEFLDPVFSSGVTLALESAVRAATLVGRQLEGEAVDWTGDYAAYVAAGVHCFRAYVDAWYNNSLPDLLFHPNPSPTIQAQITSVLAGYAWDATNPFVTAPTHQLSRIARIALR